jgi:heme-degrading monooxygenase HmoA
MILVIFRSRLTDDPDILEEYGKMATAVSERAKQTPGILSFKTFAAPDGERVTIAEFVDRAAVERWRVDALHIAAKKRGKEAFYNTYSVQICEVE